MTTIKNLRDLIDEYYKGAPWYDINGKEIECDEFILINLEEKEYEEKNMGTVFSNDKTH